MLINSVKEICLYVGDLQRTVNFYHHVLGFPIISQVKDRHVFFRVGEQVLLCFIPEVTQHEETLPPHYAFGNQHIAFEVSQEDYAVSKQKLVDSGIDIEYEQHWREGVYSCYFRDPDRHVLELVPAGLWDEYKV